MNEEAFSSVDLVGQCLIDEARSDIFEKAIIDTVKKDHNVIDMGTGSGVMAMFAARAGALKVKAVEFDSYIANVARQNVENNNYSDKIEIIEADGRNCTYKDGIKYDVVIMEMLTTGMVDEFQVQAANNLHNNGVVSKDSIFIPSAQHTFVELVNKDFHLYNFEFKMVQHLWNNLSENHSYDLYSEKKVLSEIYFNEINPELCSKIIKIVPIKDGVINAIRLSSRAIFPNDSFLDDTETFNSPVIIPIKETNVRSGTEIELLVEYKFGHGYKDFIARIVEN